MRKPRITFVAAVNDQDVLQRNLLASPCLHVAHGHQLLLQKGFSSAALAYNAAIEQATGDLVIFVHQDMYLPEGWLEQVQHSIARLSVTDPDWGVLGCWGAKADGEHCGHVYSSGLGILGGPFDEPTPVQTLDEIVLIVRAASGLVFDEALPHFHFYGTDICLRAAARGLTCYVIPAFCIHNTRQLLQLPPEFYTCYQHIKKTWKDWLPIETSCIRVSRFDREVYRRKLEDVYRIMVPNPRKPASRVADPRLLLEGILR
jgi:glycosyltransferase involved in cell wall biosynthesis